MNILQTLGRRELQTVVCHNDHPTDYLQSGTIALKFPVELVFGFLSVDACATPLEHPPFEQ